MKGTYLTLCTTKKKALKAKKEIEEYFANVSESKILFGVDERGNEGYYVEYTLI